MKISRSRSSGSDEAPLPEERGERLRAALLALDAALLYSPPDRSPVQYAYVQGNRAIALRALARVSGDPEARVTEALQAIEESLK